MADIIVNSKQLEEEILSLKSINTDIANIFARVKADTDKLAEVADTKASNAICEDVVSMYPKFEEIEAINEGLVGFLTEVVKNNYVELEAKTDALVSERM